MGKTTKEIADEILDRNNSENYIKERKPKSPKILLFLLIAIFLTTIGTMACIGSLSDNKVSFLSNLITIGITVAIFYITIHNEKRKEYKLARKNALLLSEILDSITKQLSQIDNGYKIIVFYPQEWLEYFKQCSLYLKYDYFDILVNEINTVNLINNAIEMGNEELLCKLLEERRNKIKDSAADFDIFAVCHNLRMFALEKPEDSSWKEQKIYKELDQFVLDNYTTKIKQLTENHLKELNGSCDVDIMQHYVVEELRKESAFKSGKYNHIAMQNKAIFKPIFKVYLCLTEEDNFSLCWNVLTLKNSNK